MRLFEGSAPSNLALIKYMGKTAGNLPTNSSLSYTMEKLRTSVTLEFLDPSAGKDTWSPLGEGEISISPKGVERYLAHLSFLKAEFQFEGSFHVRSANNFPSDCGLASSASSFAALTRVAVSAICEIQGREEPSAEEISGLSRQGSGSSCRSFFSPWSIWEGETARELDLPYKDLLHTVAVVDGEKKEVATSLAHKLISTSLLNQGRKSRAENRMADLLSALESQDWEKAYHISWAEFWDMHSLFETSHPAFGYFTAGTFEVLSAARQLWKDHQQGPVVTMDAGPNVHLLFLPEQKELMAEIKDRCPQFRWVGD